MSNASQWPVVGMIGGGQLARMTHPAAINLGIRFSVLCGGPDASAAQVVHDPVYADESDLTDLRNFAGRCQVVTFDHEQVSPDHLRALEDGGVILRPSANALIHAQDKTVMREALTAIDVPCPNHRVVANVAEAKEFARVSGGRAVLKTARGGYDGKGVWFIDQNTPDGDAEQPFRAAVPVLAEEKLEFSRELSALVARSPHGQAVAYPVVESVQRDGICVEVVAPAPGMRPETTVEAQRIALTIAAKLDIVGVLAVEMFETTAGALFVNELAMRPHNTGHWTIDGAVTSQFENHLRAVLDLPLGAPNARAPYTVMVNLLGGELPGVYSTYRHVLARDPELKVHWYGKAVRPGRKVGHVTVCGDDVGDLRERAWHAADYIRGVIDE